MEKWLSLEKYYVWFMMKYSLMTNDWNFYAYLTGPNIQVKNRFR